MIWDDVEDVLGAHAWSQVKKAWKPIALLVWVFFLHCAGLNWWIQHKQREVVALGSQLSAVLMRSTEQQMKKLNAPAR